MNTIALCMFSGGLAVGDARTTLCTAKNEVYVGRGVEMSKVTTESEG